MVIINTMTSASTCSETRIMYESRGQDNIASASIQTYDIMKKFKLKVRNGKRNSSCVRKEI